jgi:hypothetical protein
MRINDDNHQDKRKRTARSSSRHTLGRRDAIKLLGAGVASSAFPEMARSATVPTVSPEAVPTLAVSPNIVDVYVNACPVTFNTSSPGGIGDVIVQVGNFGPNATLGPVKVLVGTPFFANIDQSRLPSGVTVLFQDPRPNVPEIAQITVPAGFAVGSTVTFSVPLVLADTPMPIPNKGWAIANVDAVDVEANPGDNSTGYDVRMRQSSGAGPSGNPVNLFFTFMKPELTSGQTTNLPVTVGLKSGQLQGDPVFTLVTPYLTRLNPSLLQPLPANTTIVFNPPNAGAVPQILLTRVDRTLLNANLLGLLGKVTLNFPLQPTSANGPATRFGKGLVVPDPNTADIDPEPTIALSGVGIVQTT